MKLVRLLVAIKNRGVDIDRIYNHDVLNEEINNSNDLETCVPDNAKIGHNSLYCAKEEDEDAQKLEYADSSIVNDSDESSFGFYGKPIT